MRMLFTLFLTALTATSGLAISDSQEEGASLTLTRGLTTGKVSVVIDGYTHNSTLTFGGSVPLGTQLILVCQVVGLPYGTPHNYTWTCPNGHCVLPGHYARRIYSEHILAVNTTSTAYSGTYTCQVTSSGRGQDASGSFGINVTGGHIVVHTFGRLILHEFPITDLQQVSGPGGIGRITCTVSNGTAMYYSTTGTLEVGGVTLLANGSVAVLTVNITDIFQNRDIYCGDLETGYIYFYLYPTSSNNDPVGVGVINVTSSQVVYHTTAHGSTTRVITGYEVFRFGVPMIGEYVNAGIGSIITISPAVPGTQYRMAAWAFGDGSRSATPAVVYVTTGEAVPSPARSLTITRLFQDGVELNWLPLTEPNGEVHYVIEYKREDSGNWTSLNATSDSTHYNLTGLHSGTNYTIRVVAVNSAGRKVHDDTPSSFNMTFLSPAVNTAAVVAGVLVPFLFILSLLIAGIIFGFVISKRAWGKHRKASEKKVGHQKDSMAVLTPEATGDSTKEQDGTKDYDYVNEESSTEGRKALYQGLDVGTQDFVSAYTQLGGGTYQELDSRGREEEHHYQKANIGREGCGPRK